MGDSSETIYEEIADTSDEDVFQKLLVDENEYINVLKEIVQDIENLEYETGDQKLFYFFGYIDSILAYHEVQFLPDLETCKSSDEITNLFFKHKTLFHFYEDFIRIEPFFPHAMNYKVTRKIYLVEENKSVVTKRLEEYIYFLEGFAESYEVNIDRLKTAEIMLKNILENSLKDEAERFVICEIIATERRYMQNLKDNLEKYNKYVFNVNGEYGRKKEKIYGKLPQIYEQQKPLLESLEDCFFGLNIIDVMDCFLNNKIGFETYIGDQSLRCMDTIIACGDKHPEIKSMINHTSERLTKYVQFTETLKKLLKGNLPAVSKILEVENAIKDIISRVNSEIAISSIINENIDLGKQQGKLWSKDNFIISTNVESIPNKKEYMVFLFDKVVIFTVDTVRNCRQQYEYVHHFLTKRLKFKIREHCLVLSDVKMNKDVEYYKLYTKDSDKLTYWAENITNILFEQLRQSKLNGDKSIK